MNRPGNISNRRDNLEQASEHIRVWRSAVFYEIAPISFQDSNGDGKTHPKGIERAASIIFNGSQLKPCD